jgi:hypothetical protein
MKLTKPFFIRALQAFATLDVDLNMVEKARREEHRDDSFPKTGRNP